MRILTTLSGLFFFYSASAGDIVPKSYTAYRLSGSVVIDGNINDAGWKSIPVTEGFCQAEPVQGASITNCTEVRVAYDNTAIYVAASMYDYAPDSILKELGLRDETGSLNADEFRFGIDPYNNRQDAYVFHVSASGVQGDERSSDPTYDAVWQSAVQINPEGWTVEMKIPFSAIRFPKKDVQSWGVQFGRSTRRSREYDQWTLTPKEAQNSLLYWGTLNGIENIQAPLRLSFTPYLTLYDEYSPAYDENNKLFYQNLKSYSVGADLKYGIDARFTFDMTLLPDFSQVQSDNKVKNLTAFETIYPENRPFFKEGIELFTKSGLFYSRRIGQTPSGFYNVPDMLLPGESIKENPDKARLLNGMKVSGRTDKGLGIGIFNAITDNTYATIKTPEGGTRRILTEPLTNYNIFVLDQNLSHNSDVYFINTNVTREGSARDANVTTAFGAYELKDHTYRFSARSSMSRIYYPEEKVDLGNQTGLSIDRVKGKIQYGVSGEYDDKHYDKNDFGTIFYRDYIMNGAYLNYNIYNPFWKIFKMAFSGFNFNRMSKASNGALTSLDLNIWTDWITVNNYSLNISLGVSPGVRKDYYEPRVESRFFNSPLYVYQTVNASTNYNSMLAFDYGGRHSTWDIENGYHSYGYYINPIIRLSDKWSIKASNMWDKYINDMGWVATVHDPDSIIFGQRNIKTIVNSIVTRYLFKNDMALSVTVRHYWSRGYYQRFYFLNNNGSLSHEPSYTGIHDFNTNYFNVDVSYSCQFAPGSSFIITYKNQIYRDPYPVASSEFDYNYHSNLISTLNTPQTNSLSLKVLYYLDYSYFKKKV